MEVYELSIDSTDVSELMFPIPEEKEKLLQLIEEKISNGESVKEEWEEFLVLKREPKIDVDFYDIDDTGVCIVNQKTFDILNPSLDDTVEILRLKSDDQDYYILNIIKTTDCLDKEKSDCTISKTGQIVECDELLFLPEKITCPIFRLPEMPYRTLITDNVVEMYYLHHLKGLSIEITEFVGEDQI